MTHIYKESFMMNIFHELSTDGIQCATLWVNSKVDEQFVFFCWKRELNKANTHSLHPLTLERLINLEATTLKKSPIIIKRNLMPYSDSTLIRHSSESLIMSTTIIITL